jgi:hypothetical protein
MNIDTFVRKLNNISDELESLNKEASELYLQYTLSGIKNLESNEYIRLDDLIETATHETASSIEFLAHEIETFANFVTFHRTHAELSQHELEEIIDNDEMTAAFKRQILNKLSANNDHEGFEKIKNLRTNWNNTFHNKSYKQVSEYLKSGK